MVLTVEEFVERIGAVEADAIAGVGLRGARSIDREKVSAAIAVADGLILGYIRARYPAPIVPTPDLIKGFAEDIARYRLRLRTGDQSGVTEQVKQRYDDALRQLRDIQSGRLALDANQPGTANAPAEERPVLVSGRPSRADAILDAWALTTEGVRR